ncbi:MAG TPA: Spy/CpxP family protein refolding chaperone [Candidatus Acidoferrales bacterium]
MKKLSMLLALAGILAAPAVFAQAADTTAAPPPDFAAHRQEMIQHRVAYLTTVLTLTSAQQTQITAVMTNAAGNKPAFSSMKTAHTALETAIHSNDAAAMEQATTTLANLQAQEMLAHAKTEAAIYQLLTPEQQTKMAALDSEHHHGGPGGPGGPRGGGPGPGF